MAIKKKKKRRKKREPKQYELPPTAEEKSKVQYRDDFQTTIGKKVEELGSKLEGKGRIIMYGTAAFAVLLIIGGIFYFNAQKTANEAKAALGDAIETSRARITDVPLPAGSNQETFKTKKERAEAAIKKLEAVAAKYGSPYADQARYFIALNRLDIDRGAGIKELEAVAANGGNEGALAKFSLAQIRNDDGKADEAIKLYKELLALDNPVVSKVTIQFALGKIYEKQGKTKEASAIYFEIAQAAASAKDSQDKPIPLTQTETEAKARLEEIDPEKAKEIKEPEPVVPGLPAGVLN